MLKHFTGKFLRGFFALLPILISVYILVWLLTWSEAIARLGLLFFLPDSIYIPGLGIFVGVLFIYSIGNLLDKPFAKVVFRWVEGPFQILPLVRSVYQAIKDFTSYLSPNRDRQNSRVVMVRLPGTDFDVVGLVTRENLKGLPFPIETEDRMAVYLPMSYQFGGYTVFVPRAAVKELAMGTEQAMRSVLTAWVSGVGVSRDSNS
ncbi:MAG: DUF502 domain-containing protein [Bdellovibrionales bacterium]